MTRETQDHLLTALSFAGELVARLLFYSSGLRSPQRMSFEPKHPGGRQRIYSGTLPPGCFIPAAMDLPVMWPEDAKEASGHGVRARRSKSGAVSFDVLETEGGRAAL